MPERTRQGILMQSGLDLVRAIQDEKTTRQYADTERRVFPYITDDSCVRQSGQFVGDILEYLGLGWGQRGISVSRVRPTNKTEVELGFSPHPTILFSTGASVEEENYFGMYPLKLYGGHTALIIELSSRRWKRLSEDQYKVLHQVGVEYARGLSDIIFEGRAAGVTDESLKSCLGILGEVLDFGTHESVRLRPKRAFAGLLGDFTTSIYERSIDQKHAEEMGEDALKARIAEVKTKMETETSRKEMDALRFELKTLEYGLKTLQSPSSFVAIDGIYQHGGIDHNFEVMGFPEREKDTLATLKYVLRFDD